MSKKNKAVGAQPDSRHTNELGLGSITTDDEGGNGGAREVVPDNVVWFMGADTVEIDCAPQTAVAAAFLTALEPDADGFTFQTFDDSQEKDRTLAKVLHGSLQRHRNELVRLNAKGAGIFVAVNGMIAGKPRLKKNVTRVRAVFADFDDPENPPDFKRFPLEPHIIVQSSPEKYHCYWCVDGLPLEEFSQIQKSIAAQLGCDPSVCDLSRVMRLPGFVHRKDPKNTHPVTLEEDYRRTGKPPYTPDEIRKAFPPGDASNEADRPRDATERALEATPRDVGPNYAPKAMPGLLEDIRNAREGTRNETLNKKAFKAYGLVKLGLLDKSETHRKLEEAAKSAGLSSNEISTTLGSAWKSAKPDQYRLNQSGSYAGVDQDFGPQGEYQWPDLIPLNAELRPVEAFRHDLLPDPLAAFVTDHAERLGAAPDYIAVSLIVALATVIGDSATICPKQRDDGWVIIPNLWGVLVGRPSVKKSPAMAAALSPLNKLADEAREEFERKLGVYALEQEFKEAKKKADQKRITTAVSSGSEDEINELKNELMGDMFGGEAEKPTERRYICNDATVEKIGELLNENPHGILVLRDELAGFLNSLEKDAKANDRAFYMEAFNGGQHYTYDRISRGTIHIKNATVSLLGTIQPGRLGPYISQAIRQTGGDDGFVQRFQLMVYPDLPKDPNGIDRSPDQGATAAVEALFRQLSENRGEDATSPHRFSPDAQDLFRQLPENRGEDATSPHRFSPDAQALFNDWSADLSARARETDTHPAIEAHLTKYSSLMPSMALIFHLVEGGQASPVTLRAAQWAVDWCGYLESHMRRVYDGAINTAAQGAEKIFSNRKRGKGLVPSFRPLQVQQKKWSGLNDKGSVKAAIDELVERAYLREIIRNPGPKGGRPSVVYEWRPEFL